MITIQRIINCINGLRYRRANPEGLPEIVAQNTTTTQTWSYQNWYGTHIRCQHCNSAIFPSITEEDVKLSFFVPRARHAAEDPDHVQVKVLELLSGTLLPIVSLPFIDVIYIDWRLRRFRSATLRVPSTGMLRIFNSYSSSSIVRWLGFIAWYHDTKWDIAISSTGIQLRKSNIELKKKLWNPFKWITT
ncbi:uncharacterized protein LOC134221820 [Armigeres subalbatus]|uniref:uncharacterized protein LOC134221820 n=1 Tax=Armigeres subalbatus TaxID=124917 RepID=UPI002ED41F6D